MNNPISNNFPWNYGDILDAVDQVTPPDRPALIHGKRVIQWADFRQRTNNLARNLLAGGALPGDKIAFYMRNRPEYSEGIAAAFKARLTHVNVNYRYVARELLYLLDNADATVCLFSAEFAPQVRAIADQLPKVTQWIQVNEYNDGKESSADAQSVDSWLAYDEMVNGSGEPLDITRSPDDMLFLYTGGTTGMPKGVMWRHDDLWRVTGAGGNPRLNIPPCEDLDEYLQRLASDAPLVNLPLPPIMHGTGLLSAVAGFTHGGTVVTLESDKFQAHEAMQAVHDHRVTHTTIVGDAFARPIVDALNESPGQYDISSLIAINSSGVMWTTPVKHELLQHNENLLLADAFSSSEAIGLGVSLMTKDETIEIASFVLGPNCKVFSEDYREITPGSDEPGMVAVRGHLPVGYYKDEEKTARTFPVIDGERYSVPGDWVRVETDGKLTLLGRGSNCINTAGEKVYPEEVEEALKGSDAVADALVIGLPDEKWGSAITAVVQTAEGHDADEAMLRSFCREQLAAYKVPKRVLFKEDLERAPNGKANYALITDFAKAQLGLS